jgi:hypothetical protein
MPWVAEMLMFDTFNQQQLLNGKGLLLGLGPVSPPLERPLAHKSTL